LALAFRLLALALKLPALLTSLVAGTGSYDAKAAEPALIYSHYLILSLSLSLSLARMSPLWFLLEVMMMELVLTTRGAYTSTSYIIRH